MKAEPSVPLPASRWPHFPIPSAPRLLHGRMSSIFTIPGDFWGVGKHETTRFLRLGFQLEREHQTREVMMFYLPSLLQIEILSKGHSPPTWVLPLVRRAEIGAAAPQEELCPLGRSGLSSPPAEQARRSGDRSTFKAPNILFSQPLLNHHTTGGVLAVSCAGPGTGLDVPCGSPAAQDILCLWGRFQVGTHTVFMENRITF